MCAIVRPLNRRERTYDLCGNPIILCEGDCALTNTGWRTWAGAWLLARHMERHLAGVSEPRRLLDLSCGTGLAGIALACAGHEVVLSDLDINVPTIRANLARNLPGAVRDDSTLEAMGNRWVNAQANCSDLSNVASCVEKATQGATGGSAASVSVLGYAWGRSLPEEMRRPFDIVLCGDLLYHVWNGRLHDQFYATLCYLNRHVQGKAGTEFLFGFQVRSGRQEEQVLETAARRLGLIQEELTVESGDLGDPIIRDGKYRVVRLRPPTEDEEQASTS